jgi:hypothetical protein
MKKVAPWMEANNLFGRDRFGISLDDPLVTKPQQCRYDACVSSPEGEVIAGDAQRKVIPGGRYASLAFEGTGAPRSERPGMRYCATGCRRAACSSTHGRSLNTTRLMAATIRKPERSAVTSVSPSPRSDEARTSSAIMGVVT